jgi:cytochrome c oxidase assembly factor CtaG
MGMGQQVSILLGAIIVYLIPAVLAVPFWLCVRRLAALWTGRDFMCSLIPTARSVNQTEILLHVRNHPN